MKSSIDWCESNYTVLPFVAEFFNTISGVVIYMFSKVFYTKYYRYVYDIQEFSNIHYWLTLVSIGTMLFHGFLLYPFQLLDELPMLYVAAEYIVILQKRLEYKKTVYITRPIIYLASVLVSLSYFYHPNLQITLFHTCLDTSILIVFVLLRQKLKLVSQTIKKQINYKVNIGLFCFVSSICSWLLENMFCQFTQMYQLHAWWHVLSSIGIYQLNGILALISKDDKDNVNVLTNQYEHVHFE